MIILNLYRDFDSKYLNIILNEYQNRSTHAKIIKTNIKFELLFVLRSRLMTRENSLYFSDMIIVLFFRISSHHFFES